MDYTEYIVGSQRVGHLQRVGRGFHELYSRVAKSWTQLSDFHFHIYGCESWTIKKAEHQRIDVFKLWCCRRLLRVPCTAKRLNQSILKEINPEYPLEGLMLTLKLQ